ncbi:MAG: nifI5 [Lachnospiraceae bacterium]|jgi:nitrogen regulatory protein PII 2|nr:nifI5 [Lachnospiraceae bacterium]
MKEIMAIVRQNKVNETKEALADIGIPGFTCRKVLGRGKKLIDMTLLTSLVDAGELPANQMGEHISETARLISKRAFTFVVNDEDVTKVVQTLMDVNSTGNPGDGKIFVLPIYDNYQIRNGEKSIEAY